MINQFMLGFAEPAIWRLIGNISVGLIFIVFSVAFGLLINYLIERN